MGELTKKKTGIANGYPLLVCVLVSVAFLICMVVMFKWVAEKDNVVTESLVSVVPSSSYFCSYFLEKI